jgi:hypothetical protein
MLGSTICAIATSWAVDTLSGGVKLRTIDVDSVTHCYNQKENFHVVGPGPAGTARWSATVARSVAFPRSGWVPPHCPDYLRGRVGTVLRRHGAFRLPDLEAHGRAGPREGVCTVRFGAGEVWGDGQAHAGINADLWDSYLEPT